jgi:protein SCO1
LADGTKKRFLMMPRHFLLLGLAILTGLGAVLATQIFVPPYKYQGSLYDPPLPAKDFVLPDQRGNPFQLSEQQGRVVLLFFGYINCPDVCPITLTEFRQIKSMLGERAERVDFVFITVDPERDTPERIAAHLQNFDPTFIGLTGELADLEAVWDSYGVFQAKVDVGSAAGYLVDHTSRVYAIDAAGDLRLTYSFGTGSQVMAEDIYHLLEE